MSYYNSQSNMLKRFIIMIIFSVFPTASMVLRDLHKIYMPAYLSQTQKTARLSHLAVFQYYQELT